MTPNFELMGGALELKREIDVTGIATVLLAGGTVYLATTTRTTAVATQRAAAAAQDAANAAREQLRAARRPLLTPTITAAPPASGPAGNPEQSLVLIPVVNMGATALDVVIHVAADPAPPGAPPPPPVQQSALASGGEIHIHLSTFGGLAAPPFRLDMTYRDVAGEEYATATRWIPDEHRYDEIKLSDTGVATRRGAAEPPAGRRRWPLRSASR